MQPPTVGRALDVVALDVGAGEGLVAGVAVAADVALALGALVAGAADGLEPPPPHDASSNAPIEDHNAMPRRLIRSRFRRRGRDAS